MATLERRLFVFFSAGGVRYALPAVAVAEVATPDEGGETVRGHLGLRDLAVTLGGTGEPGPGAALVLDTSPTRAVRVGRVEGVFDVTGLPTPALTRRIIPLVSPAVRGAFVRDGQLVFELELDALSRGLAKQVKALETVATDAKDPALVFVSRGQRYAVPLPWVRQVVAMGPLFNASPTRGPLVGVWSAREGLAPVYALEGAHEPEALVVLCELNGEPLGLTAERAEGVKGREALGDARVLDLERMFS